MHSLPISGRSSRDPAIQNTVAFRGIFATSWVSTANPSRFIVFYIVSIFYSQKKQEKAQELQE